MIVLGASLSAPCAAALAVRMRRRDVAPTVIEPSAHAPRALVWLAIVHAFTATVLALITLAHVAQRPGYHA